MAELRSGLVVRRAVAKSGSVGLGGWLGVGRCGVGRMVVRRAVAQSGWVGVGGWLGNRRGGVGRMGVRRAVARAGSVGVGQNASRRVGMRLGVADVKGWDVGAKLVWKRDRA